MQIKLKVVKLTIEGGNAVVKLEPSLVEPRAGDQIAGELFLTTAETNMVLGMNDEVVIDFTGEEQPIEG